MSKNTNRRLRFEQMEQRRMMASTPSVMIDTVTLPRNEIVLQGTDMTTAVIVNGLYLQDGYSNCTLHAYWTNESSHQTVDHDLTSQLVLKSNINNLPVYPNRIADTYRPEDLAVWNLSFTLTYQDAAHNEHSAVTSGYTFVVYSLPGDYVHFNTNTTVTPADTLNGDAVLVDGGATLTMNGGSVSPHNMDIDNATINGTGVLKGGPYSLQGGTLKNPVAPTLPFDLFPLPGNNEFDQEQPIPTLPTPQPFDIQGSGSLRMKVGITTGAPFFLNLADSGSSVTIQGDSGVDATQSTVCDAITGPVGSTVSYSCSNQEWVLNGGGVLPLPSFFAPGNSGTNAYAPEFDGNLSAGSSGLDVRGFQVLCGTDSYSGGTIIETGAYLGIGGSGAIGSGSVTMHGGSYLQSISNVTIVNGIVSADASSVVQIDNDCNDLTIVGAISGPGGVAFTSSGTTTISGACTYTGPTYVASGCTLVIAAGGSLAGPVILEGGNLVVNTAGGLADGSSLTVGDPSAIQQAHMLMLPAQSSAQLAAAAAKRAAMHALLNAWHAADAAVQNAEARMLSPAVTSFSQLSQAQQNAVFMGNITAKVSAILGPNLTGSGGTAKSVDAAMAIFWSNLGRKVSVSSGAVSAATVFSNPTNDPILAFDNLEMAWLATHTVSA